MFLLLSLPLATLPGLLLSGLLLGTSRSGLLPTALATFEGSSSLNLPEGIKLGGGDKLGSSLAFKGLSNLKLTLSNSNGGHNLGYSKIRFRGDEIRVNSYVRDVRCGRNGEVKRGGLAWKYKRDRK